MSFAAFRQAIEAAFDTAWAGTTAIKWENVDFTEPADEFVSFQLVPQNVEQISISATPTMREDGVIRVTIHVRPSIGTARTEALADLVAAALQRASLPSGVECYATSRLPGERRGDWFITPTETAYQGDYTA